MTYKLEGQKFGELKVIKRDGSNKWKEALWLCQCDCGNLCHHTSRNLVKGRVKTCGKHIYNPIGGRFGRLFVKELHSIDDRGRRKFLCQCDCGNETVVSGSALKSGDTKSCGCLWKEKMNAEDLNEDIILMKVNDYYENNNLDYIAKKAYQCKRKNSTRKDWKVLAECKEHEKFKMDYYNIINLHQTCPKCSFSKGENKICEYLKTNDIDFEEQHRFKDCKYRKSLPFDFYIPSLNIAIEYDGKQHFEVVPFSKDKSKNIENFERCQQNDRIKNKYCKDNNIKLIRIPYTDFDNIEKILDKMI